MKYLSPEIEKLSKNKPAKSLAKKGVSCGIFQDLGEDIPKQNNYEKQN